MQNQPHTSAVTNQMLAGLASPNFRESLGEWTDEKRASLSIAVPAMAAELLERRGAITRIKQITEAEQSLREARAIIRAPEPIHPRRLLLACKSILRHTCDQFERSAAQDVLAQLERKAA